MTKILFVCHGNICRSPAAEFVLRELLDRAGLGEEYTVASAATSSEEIGLIRQTGQTLKLKSLVQLSEQHTPGH